MGSITPDELADLLESGEEPFLLDIRPVTDFEANAIETSHNVPVYADLLGGDESEFRNRLDELPADREIVVVCKRGIAAKRATKILTDEGHDARTLAGGMSGWVGYRNDSLTYRLRSLLWKLR